MLLSDIIKKKLPLFFVRFSQKQYLEDFQKGKLFMNNLKKYIEEEEKTGIKGVGDKHEASHVLNDLIIKMYDSETNEFITEIPAGSIMFREDQYLYKPVLCLFTMWSDSFHMVSEDEDFIYAKLVFSKEQKEKIKEHFGENALIIPSNAFLGQVHNKFIEKEFDFVHGLVKYSDYKVNESKRFEIYSKRTAEIAFIKDKSFQYQNEYRILIKNQDVEDHLEVKIGEIEGTSLLETEYLLNDNFAIKINKDAITKL
jgi:hypothetical protein